MEHVRDELSAYLDGALVPARRADVEVHLRTCDLCRASLAELRSTARLIAALPAALPSRRLVPSLAPRANWLRPLRSLSAVAAGMFVLLFMASATLDTGFRMGGGDAKATSGRLIGGPTPAAAPAASTFDSAPRTETASAAAVRAGSPAPQVASDAQRSSTQSTAQPKAVGPQASPADQLTGAAQGAPAAIGAAEPVRLGTPWLWLGLTVLSAALALVAHRRLRDG